MQDFLVEVINYIPSYYPFSQKDGSIGLADFYAQEPVYTHNKLHDDPVYRDFKKTCDVIGLPVGPCNKLLSGSNLDCIRTKPPTSPPAPICQSGPGISLPCRCDCSGACLYRSSNASDYIEEWDRDELLALIDSVRKFPEVDTTDDNNTSVDDGYQRMITHELAGNGYWIGLPPSCDGIWVTIVSCDADENGFKGFYKLDAPVFGNNDIELKGRGQRIKIETETPGIYKKYQVYYAYEFEYKLGITPPNDMTFLLADSNIVENAVEDDDPLALNGDTYSYSRFCYDEFVKFTMRNCVAPTDNKGTFGQAPCVCDGEFNTTVNLNDTEKYVLKKDVPERTLEYGVFSIENESTGYCMNGAFERKGSTTGTAESTLPFYQYYDAFSRDTIRWNQINSFNTAWEGEAGGANEDNWYSWEKTEEFDSYTWDSTKVRENCYECLNQKKRQNQRDEVPPCENVMCGRVTINADPDGSVVDAWKALDGPAAGYGNITSNQVKEWDMFSKFGFPTLYSYNPLGLFSDNGKWYDEIKERFVDSGTFIPESTQYTIPCFPTITCPDGQARASSIIDISIPCSDLYNSINEVTVTTVGASGVVHKIYAGTDYRPDEGCRSCAECTPSDCCSPIYGFYEIASSPIGHAFYYPIYSETDDVTKIVDTLSLYDTTLFECYVANCNRNKLEENYNYCMDNGLMEEGCNCICYAINQCTEDIIENYNEIYNCNPEVNTFDNSLFNRASAYNWTYAGNPISECSGGGTQLTVPFSCVYEVKPVRPSSSYWVDVERGQCEVTTETTCGCSVTYQNKRTDPIYFGSSTDSTANTCPVMFCSKCLAGTKSSCSCCGVSRFGSSDGQSQSIYDDCSNCSRTRTNCCPDCCSMCNGNLVDSCGESVGNIDPNWKSEEPCGTTKCGWSYWDYMDCGQKYQTKDRSGNICQDSNACQPICTANPEICEECEQIYEKIDCDDDVFPGDTAGSDNGGFGKDGSFYNGGLGN